MERRTFMEWGVMICTPWRLVLFETDGSKSPNAVTSTVWPSGLRRCVKAAVRKGVGSNPTAVI